jgi:hypothetical protein
MNEGTRSGKSTIGLLGISAERPTNGLYLYLLPWCGVASFGVIGPYFFEDESGRAVTVNSARYTEMLRTFLESELQRLGVENKTLCFQQDGATAHIARTAVRFLNKMFPARVISRRGNIEWPARSPDLNACDFVHWG